MTTRELRLRQRIDVLIDQCEAQREKDAATITALRKKLRQRFKGRPSRCRWCGKRTYKGRVCGLHYDLEQMERELYR